MASRWDSSHIYIRGAQALWRGCLRGCFGETSLSVPFQVACSPNTGVVHIAGVGRDMGSWDGLGLLTLEVSLSIALLRGAELSVCLLVEIGQRRQVCWKIKWHFFIALRERASTSIVPRVEICVDLSKFLPSLLHRPGASCTGSQAHICPLLKELNVWRVLLWDCYKFF